MAGFAERWLVGGFQSVCVMRVGATGASVIAPDRGGPRRLAFTQSSFNRGETRYSNSRDFYQQRTRLLAMPNKCFATRSREPNKRNEKVFVRAGAVFARLRLTRLGVRVANWAARHPHKNTRAAHHMLTGLVCISHPIKVTAENSISLGNHRGLT